MSKENRRVCLGVFIGAHGVKGGAKIKTFTACEKDIAAYGPVTSDDGGRLFTLTFIRTLKSGVALVSAPEIESREEAAALSGVRLYVDRNALPEPEDEEFYFEDLLGLEARTTEDDAAGQVIAVYNFGAGDLLELSPPPGRKRSVMIPFTRAAAPVVDLERGRVTVDHETYLAAAEDGASERRSK